MSNYLDNYPGSRIVFVFAAVLFTLVNQNKEVLWKRYLVNTSVEVREARQLRAGGGTPEINFGKRSISVFV